MAARRPLVNVSGSVQELPAGDAVSGLENVTNKTQQHYHGFTNRTSSTLAFDNSTHVFTLGVAASATVYVNGVSYTISSPGLTIDLDTKTLSTGVWFIWIEISGGVPVLNASKTAWSITSLTEIPVATVHWNGSAGALCEERHAHDRNLQAHLWQHKTVGARVENDGSFAQTLPTTATDGQLELVGGILWDEDIQNVIANPVVRCRVWYETAAGTWTWVDGTDNAGKDRPYLWNGGTSRLRFPESDNGYALADGTNANFIPVWVYASNDISRPIYIVVPSLTAAYTTIALARSATPPVPALSPEVKLLWRWIFRGDGEYQEAADYRTAASLPSGGVTAPAAVSVSFAPTDTLTSTNVQAAIEETVDIIVSVTLAYGQLSADQTWTGTQTFNGLEINDSDDSHQYVLAVSNLAADRTVTLPLLTAGDTFVFEAHTQTLSGKTLTLPKINDTSANNTYNFGVSELAANRTITLPLLTGNDTFVFEAHSQTLTNKTISADSNTLSGIAASSFVLSNSSGNIDGSAAQKVIPSGAVVGTTDTQTLSAKTLTDPIITGCILEDVHQITDDAAFEVDPGNGSIQYITLGAARTPKATNFAAGEAVILMVDDGTAYTITWTDATWGGSGVIWLTTAGTAPTLATTGYTAITLWKIGTQVYGKY